MFRRFEATRYITRSVSPEKSYPITFSAFYTSNDTISFPTNTEDIQCHYIQLVLFRITIQYTKHYVNRTLFHIFSVTQPHRLRDNGQQPIIYIDTQTPPIVLLQGKCRVLWGWDRIRWTMNVGAELRICACTYLERLQTLRRESDD